MVNILGLQIPRELLRILVAWIVLSAIGAPLVWFVLGPNLPPGTMSDVASGQTSDNTVMVTAVTPIIILLALYFGYCLTQFRHRGGVLQDGAPIRGDGKTMGIWIAATTAIVLGLAGWGSYELFPGQHGAGGGMGPSPLSIAIPSNSANALKVQVIGQQWQWTFRYPDSGDFETDQLVLPVDQLVEFHVTSLDVIHSFWAIALGVKADAVPGSDNIAFAQASRTGTFDVRCAELCGLWHGHMYTTGRVTTQDDFQAWASQEQQTLAPATKNLPPYSPIYYPTPVVRGT
jgi:cytochrome c oxidase subunit 2